MNIKTMDKKTFSAVFMATFLSSYAAKHYDANIKPQMFTFPIEDAAELAQTAWDKIQEILTL